MRSRKLAAIAALSLITASTAATAQAVPAPAEPARAGAEMDQSSDLRGGSIIPIIGVVALILAILALTDTWPFDGDGPDSP